jgi:hypothetical protein
MESLCTALQAVVAKTMTTGGIYSFRVLGGKSVVSGFMSYARIYPVALKRSSAFLRADPVLYAVK